MFLHEEKLPNTSNLDEVILLVVKEGQGDELELGDLKSLDCYR